jgi:hypothetical protein
MRPFSLAVRCLGLLTFWLVAVTARRQHAAEAHPLLMLLPGTKGGKQKPGGGRLRRSAAAVPARRSSIPLR